MEPEVVGLVVDVDVVVVVAVGAIADPPVVASLRPPARTKLPFE